MAETQDFSELVTLTTELQHAGWRVTSCAWTPESGWDVRAMQEGEGGFIRELRVVGLEDYRQGHYSVTTMPAALA